MSYNFILKEAVNPSYGRPPLLDAVYRKDLQRVRDILSQPEPASSVSVLGDFGENALHAACYRGLYEISEEIIHAAEAQGRNLCNVQLRKLRPPLPTHSEGRGPTGSALVSMLAHEIQRKGATQFTETPFHAACSSGNLDLVKLLLKHGAVADDTHVSPLMCAVRHGHNDVVRWLLSNASVNIDIRDRGERTPLLAAAELGFHDIVQTLVEAGAEMRQCDNLGRGPLHHAVIKRQLRCVETLARCGADLHASDHHGATPAHIAARKGHRDTLDVLCDAGVDINVQNKIQTGCDTPLYEAIHTGHRKVVELLLERGARLDLDTEFSSMLHAFFLSNRCSVPLLRTLIAAGANVNYRNGMGYSLLHFAADKSWWDVAYVLLDCDLNLKREVNWIRDNLADNDVMPQAREFYREALGRVGAARSLKAQCRLTVRAALRHRGLWPYRLRVEQLGLPGSLAQYVMYLW